MITDIRSERGRDLRPDILTGLRRKRGHKILPTQLLYDEQGLQLYQRIMELEHCPMDAEISTLERDMDEILDYIPDGATLIELGACSFRKTKLILEAVEKLRRGVSYFAQDLGRNKLAEFLEHLGPYKNIETYGLWGAYQDALKFMKDMPEGGCRVVLWLCPSIESFDPEGARGFLRELESMLKPGDRMILGTRLLNEDRVESCRLVCVAHPQAPFFFEDPVHPIPEKKEWDELWRAWDYICHLITDDLLFPASSIYILPWTHPAFLDIQLAKHFNEAYTPPTEFAAYFERGIDPDVNDPTKCHGHSELPSVWPTRKEITEYQGRVRSRLIVTLSLPCDTRLGRVLSYTFEHQAMHIETLLYMLIRVTPLANATTLGKKASLLTVASGTIRIGLDDDENQDSLRASATAYGWDNEMPSRELIVNQLQLDSRPVTNGEFLEFLKATINLNYPATWLPIELPQFSFNIMSFNGPVSMKRAINWPVMVSYDQALAYAEWRNMRLPTEPELNRARELHSELARQADLLGASANYKNRLYFPRTKVFNANLRRWQPVEVVDNGGFQLYGDGWEWTSTLLTPHAGFRPSELYPGYTADFFDNKHMVLLGGSYATHPRISTRRSFRNWYHRAYPYVFATFRCAV
ncbi:hypothetical protein L0F63_006540 [Massospora cicadina]|nr:hypothetical protein L0F63_006540 [Massospora cicadina]